MFNSKVIANKIPHFYESYDHDIAILSLKQIWQIS